MPKVHAADRLTIAEAQRRMPFAIVVPKGLPTGSRLLYAHVVSENPNPRVSLQYEAHVGAKYYDININELTGAVGPPVKHIEIRRPGAGAFRFRYAERARVHGTKSWDLPVRRWKHGAVVMEMVPNGLPAAMSDRIVRANTM